MAFWSSRARARQPKMKYYGGSRGDLNNARQWYNSQEVEGGKEYDKGLAQNAAVAQQAGQSYGRLNDDLQDYRSDQERLAGKSEAGFDAQQAAVASNARVLERDAANMGRDYQQTAEMQFARNQDANTRSALAMGARGGASGLRTALATQSNANAGAARDAEVIRANEANQMIGLKQQALTSAAGIRQGAAGQYSNRQQVADANQAGANAQMASNVGNEAQIGQNAAALQTQAGASKRDTYLQARQDTELAQLNAAREQELARTGAEKDRFNRMRDPFGLHSS